MLKSIKNLILGFLLKEFYIEKSYKLGFLSRTVSVIFQLLIFYFLCKLISPQYFEFLFIGILFSRSVFYSFTSFNEIIRQEQYWETIENLILLPYNEFIIFIISIIPKYLFLFIETIFYLIFANFLGLYFTWLQIIIIVIILTIFNILFIPFGIFFASITIYVRKGENLSWLIISLIDLLSGIYFSITELPKYLQNISLLLPTTYALNFLRSSLDSNTKIDFHSLTVVLIYSIIFFPISILFFKHVLKVLLKKGSLGVY